MADKFRLALIGAGRITQASHLPAALTLRQVEVKAIVDPVPARAVELAARYGIQPLIVSDINDVLHSPGCMVDGAIIATPNHTHKDLSIRCLEAGVSVLVEK